MDLALHLLLLLGLHNLTIVVHHSPHGILFPNLFNLVGQVLDLRPRRVHIASQLLAPPILLLEERSIILHGLILPVALPEHLKCLGPVSQVLHGALDRPISHILRLLKCLLKCLRYLLLLLSHGLLIQLEVHSLLLDRLLHNSTASVHPTSCSPCRCPSLPLHHLE